MRRADRLLDLVARLKAKPLARADDLAQAMETSVRTIYRDIAALQAHGLPIEGQAGVGYMLRGEITLPPLVFNHDQLEALALGLAYVEHVGDPDLATAAHEARAKVDAAWAGQPTRFGGRARPNGGFAHGNPRNTARLRLPPCCGRRCERGGWSRSPIAMPVRRLRSAAFGPSRLQCFRTDGCLFPGVPIAPISGYSGWIG